MLGDDNLWIEVRYLVTLLVATAVSMLSFRREMIDKRVEDFSEEFQEKLREEENTLLSGSLVSSFRLRKGAVSSIITMHILEAGKYSRNRLESDRQKGLREINQISRELVSMPLLASFCVFLIMLMLIFSKDKIDSWTANWIWYGLYIIVIGVFLYLSYQISKIRSKFVRVAGCSSIAILLCSPFFIPCCRVIAIPLFLLPLLFLHDVHIALDGPSYFNRKFKHTIKYILSVYLLWLCIFHICVGSVCMMNGEARILFFSVAPIDIFTYFLISVIGLYFFVEFRLKIILKRIFNYIALKRLFPGLEQQELEKYAKDNYFKRLQLFVASSLDGLLLARIQRGSMDE